MGRYPAPGCTCTFWVRGRVIFKISCAFFCNIFLFNVVFPSYPIIWWPPPWFFGDAKRRRTLSGDAKREVVFLIKSILFLKFYFHLSFVLFFCSMLFSLHILSYGGLHLGFLVTPNAAGHFLVTPNGRLDSL